MPTIEVLIQGVWTKLECNIHTEDILPKSRISREKAVQLGLEILQVDGQGNSDVDHCYLTLKLSDGTVTPPMRYEVDD